MTPTSAPALDAPPQAVDLSRLQRAGASGSQVPLPPRRWLTQVGLPLLITASCLALLAHAAGDVLTPQRRVTVVPVVIKQGGDVQAAPAFSAAGWLEPAPYPIQVSALADGVIKSVDVLEGARVQRGDTIATMVDDDARLQLQAAEAELDRRRAMVVGQRATLEAAELEAKHRTEANRMLATRQLDVVELGAELERQTLLEKAAEAKVELLASQHRRLIEARKSSADAVTASALEQSQLALELERAQLAVVAKGRQITLIKRDRARAEVAAASEVLKLAIEEQRAVREARAALARSEAEVTKAGVEVAEAKLRLSRMRVIVPIDSADVPDSGCLVMTRIVSPGSKVKVIGDNPHSAHVAHLYDPNKLQVRVDVPLADAAGVGVGMRARVVVETLPGRVFEGEVTRLVHEADIAKNTIEVKVALDAPDKAFKPEMLARVEFLTPPKQEEQSQARSFVPANLVGEDAGGRYVWLAREGKAPERRAVELGQARDGDWVEVRGLSHGDRLVSLDPQAVDPTTRLTIIGEAGGQR